MDLGAPEGRSGGWHQLCVALRDAVTAEVLRIIPRCVPAQGCAGRESRSPPRLPEER